MGTEEDLIGDDVELGLSLALNVDRARLADEVDQRALADDVRDPLAGKPEVVDEGREAARGVRDLPLLIDDELGQRLLGRRGHDLPSVAGRSFGSGLPCDPSTVVSLRSNTRLARLSSASMVIKSSRPSGAPRRSKSRFACRRRARASALRMGRALAKFRCIRRRAMYSPRGRGAPGGGG